MNLTIRARVTEKVKDNGVGYPETVTVTGAEDLSADTVREIAQSAVNNMYGTYETGYLATLGYVQWARAQGDGSATNFTVEVVEL
jgi:hypothetical protein